MNDSERKRGTDLIQTRHREGLVQPTESKKKRVKKCTARITALKKKRGEKGVPKGNGRLKTNKRRRGC